MIKKNAIIFGSSGFVGSYLLNDLLLCNFYERIIVVNRSEKTFQHPKLKYIITDFHSLKDKITAIEVDDVYICLGTTKKKSPNKEDYYQIDHDYPVLAAKLCKDIGATSIAVVSALGSDISSKIFYSKTKGEMEQDIIKLQYEHTHIFRPSLILGNRKEQRFLERILIKVWPFIHWLFIGKASKYKGIYAYQIAQAMLKAINEYPEKLNFYYWKDIKKLN